MEALYHICNVPWWRRIWVVQESVLPKHVEFQAGPFIMPYSCFQKAFENWRKHERFSECCFRDMPWFFDHYRSFSFFRHFDRHQFLHRVWQNNRDRSELPPILSIFSIFYDFGATDPRDKVYALLPFASMWWGADQLVPNYSLNVSEVYTQTALKIMACAPRPLDVLVLSIRKGNKSLNLPSWVPD
jgi:hypothetical protein